MQARVLYFGVLKDIFRAESELVDLPAGATVGLLLHALRQRTPERSGLWSLLAVAVNQEYVGVSCALSEGDEVALLPPVSGGSAGRSVAGRANRKVLRFAQDDSVWG